jgi:hypothetical protein
MSPRPAPRHTRLALRLSTLLYGPFDEGIGGPGGWIFLPEPELHLGNRPDKMEPDRVRAEPFETLDLELARLWRWHDTV